MNSFCNHRLPDLTLPTSPKPALVLDGIQRQPGEFSAADLQKECPGVSLDIIRHLLDRLRKDKRVKCLSTGRNARWQNVAN